MIGEFAYLVNPGRKRRRKSKAKTRKPRTKGVKTMARRRRRRVKVAAPRRRRRRSRARRRSNPIFMNPRRRRRSRRRRNPIFANPRSRRRRSSRRRRNPSFRGILGNFTGHLKHAVPGGALAGVFDLYVGDKIAPRIPIIPPAYSGASKILLGAAVATVMDKVGPLRKYSNNFAAGMAAIGAKELVGRLTNAPAAAMKDLADYYQQEIERGEMGALGDGGMGSLGYTDVMESSYSDM